MVVANSKQPLEFKNTLHTTIHAQGHVGVVPRVNRNRTDGACRLSRWHKARVQARMVWAMSCVAQAVALKGSKKFNSGTPKQPRPTTLRSFTSTPYRTQSKPNLSHTAIRESVCWQKVILLAPCCAGHMRRQTLEMETKKRTNWEPSRI